jgi:hypothetical protein
MIILDREYTDEFEQLIAGVGLSMSGVEIVEKGVKVCYVFAYSEQEELIQQTLIDEGTPHEIRP